MLAPAAFPAGRSLPAPDHSAEPEDLFVIRQVLDHVQATPTGRQHRSTQRLVIQTVDDVQDVPAGGVEGAEQG